MKSIQGCLKQKKNDNTLKIMLTSSFEYYILQPTFPCNLVGRESIGVGILKVVGLILTVVWHIFSLSTEDIDSEKHHKHHEQPCMNNSLLCFHEKKLGCSIYTESIGIEFNIAITFSVILICQKL